VTCDMKTRSYQYSNLGTSTIGRMSMAHLHFGLCASKLCPLFGISMCIHSKICTLGFARQASGKQDFTWTYLNALKLP
jgi:hypothetical protein